LTLPDLSGLTIPKWWQQLFTSQREEARRVLAELLSLRGLMPLLMKPRNGSNWTPAEREALLQHLRRLTRLSPYLLFLLLPGSALLLPVYAWWLDRRRQRRPDERREAPASQ
jgi:hypothetical protein